MLNVILIILVFGVLVAFQIPPLIKKQQWRELVVSALLFGIAFVLAMLRALGVI